MSEFGRGQSIKAYGLETNFHEDGEGYPIVFLHGSGPGVSAWTNWKKVLPEFAKSYRVIAPDMAGFGYTERNPDFEYNIKQWGKHLLGILDALNIEQCHVVGNSFGGSLALATAARFPERFNRICLMGTPCDKFEMTDGLRAGWGYTPSHENMRAVMTNFPFDQSVITTKLVEERYQTSLIPGAQEGLQKLLAKPNDTGPTMLSGMPEKVVSSIDIPTLILHGREDHVIPMEMGLRLARSMPQAELHLFGQCGHWVQAERFSDFVNLALRHFDKAAA